MYFIFSINFSIPVEGLFVYLNIYILSFGFLVFIQNIFDSQYFKKIDHMKITAFRIISQLNYLKRMTFAWWN